MVMVHQGYEVLTHSHVLLMIADSTVHQQATLAVKPRSLLKLLTKLKAAETLKKHVDPKQTC